MAVLGLGAVVVSVLMWRQGQLAGYGLRGTYYGSTDFTGQPLATQVDRSIDFSSTRDVMFQRARLSVEWNGTLALPRTGSYRFAIVADGSAALDVDGVTLVEKRETAEPEQHEGERVLAGGGHALRIRYARSSASAALRVLWMPARQGLYEYLPATLLLPVAPEQADVGHSRAVAPCDQRAVAWLMLAGLLACLCWARRPLRRWMSELRQQPLARLDALLALALGLGALLPRLWELSAAGLTAEEEATWSAARSYLLNLLAGDLRPQAWSWGAEHPPLAKWLYGPATLLGDDLGAARIMAALLGAMTCAAVYLVGKELTNRRVSFMGASLCTVLPHIVAHHRVVGLEAPSGLCFTVAIWLCFRAVRTKGNNSLYLVTGLCVGLALATRLTNLTLLAVVAALYFAAHAPQIWRERSIALPLSLCLLPCMTLLVVVAVWPLLWHDPLAHLAALLRANEAGAPLEYFLGRRQLAPWYYCPLYFVVTMPVVILLFLALGLVRAMVRRDLGHLTLLCWLLMPFLVLFAPTAQHGVRLLYPALFAACLLAAAGLDWLCTGVAALVRTQETYARAAALLGAALGVYVLHAGLSVHPYYLDYYNELVGGPRRVADRHWFVVGWWGEGLAAAADYVNQLAPSEARVLVHAIPAHVVRLRPDLQLTSKLPADFVIHNSVPDDSLQLAGYSVAHTVRAAGAPLAWVYRRDDDRDEAAALRLENTAETGRLGLELTDPGRTPCLEQRQRP